MLFSQSATCFPQDRKDILKVKSDTVSADSVEYKLIVFDPGFESWLVTQPSASFHSKGYYEMKNRLYVNEWNYRYEHELRYGNLYENRIEYYPDVDYGLDLNYRLYYFFRYFEEQNKIRLILP